MAVAYAPRLNLEEALLEMAQGLTPLEKEGTPERRPTLLEWTEAHRTIGGVPLLPSRIPWLRDLYAWVAPEIVVMKASQVFISEWMVNTGLWVCDTGQGGRGNALYGFPTQREADDFSQARVDGPLGESAYLAERTGMVYETKGGRKSRRASVARVRLRRIGKGHLYLRGADKRNQLLTVDADAILVDEVDEWRRGRLTLARQRLNSSLDPIVRIASTPKFPSSGIAPLWAETTRRRYHVRCRVCGKAQHLTFPENLDRQGRLHCAFCPADIDPLSEGEWVAENPGAPVEGFHVNRLYSHRADLKALARTGYDILDHVTTDPEEIQEFHNQSLGLPHAPAGGALTDDILNACVAKPPEDYSCPAPPTGQPVVMGVDVGGVLHWWVKGPAPDQVRNPGATRLIDCGTAPNNVAPDGRVWPEIAAVMDRHRVRLTVVDALPEDERSARFAQEHYGRVYRCFYHDESQWKYAAASAWNVLEHVVHAQRTRVMDAMFNRFHQAREQLPRDARYHPTLYPHLKAPVRVLVTDTRGRQTARYQEGLAADHFAHAAVYAELANVFVTDPQAPATVNRPKRKPLKVRG